MASIYSTANPALNDPRAYLHVDAMPCPYCGQAGARPYWNRGTWEFLHGRQRLHINAQASGRPIECTVVLAGCRQGGPFGLTVNACPQCRGRGGAWQGREPLYTACHECRGTGGHAVARRKKGAPGVALLAPPQATQVEEDGWARCPACAGQKGTWDFEANPDDWRACDGCEGTGRAAAAVPG